MKYLVVSDNHGDRNVLVQLANFWQGKVDGMFHCGDSELDPTDELWQKYIVVRGNCDYHPQFDNECVINLDEDRIYLTHGHLFNVNMGLTDLSFSARDKKATLCFYGHTHKLAAEMEQDILFLNPGSISQPRGQYRHLKTYAIIETSKEQIVVTYYDSNHHAVDDLSLTFSR